MPTPRSPVFVLFAASVAAASLIASTGATAAIAPDGPRLLAQARTANPGWDRVDGVVIESTIHASGLDGRYVEIDDVREGRFDRLATYRPFAQREVWNGHVFWRQDNSGGVHRLDGAFAMRHHVTEAWMVRRGWLRADALGAYIGPVAMRSDAGHDYAVIEAVPSGGQAIELWFDPSTLDLVRTERVMPTLVVQTRYSDYRVVDGLRIPFTTEADEHDDNVETIRLTRIDPHARLARDAFAQPAMPNDWSFADGPTTVPIDFRNGVLTIAAAINGKSYRFIFDTGGHSIVSPEVAKELGLDIAGAGQSGGAGEGTIAEQYTRIAKVAVGGLTLKDQHFYVLPLGYATFERGTEPPIAGLLGLEVLERVAVRIDYRAKTMTFSPFGARRLDPKAIVTPLTFDDDIPLVDARLGGQPGVFALDTGNASTLVVQHRWAERVGIAARMKAGLETASFGAGGVSRNWASRVDRFEIGGITLDRLVARYAEDQRGAFASRTEAGNLGTQVLAHFVLDFDYRAGRMSWLAQPGYEAPPFNRAGVRALKEGPDDFLVVVVAKDSPGDVAGVRAKDRIVALDGVPAARLSGADFNETVARREGTVVTFDLMRDGKPLVAKVTLRELLP